MNDWHTEMEAEFERAERARQRGNEGQARVCARRAAGIAARQYFARRGETIRTPSAYDLLNKLAQDRQVSSDLRQSANYLTLRVNEEFKLPLEVDIIAEARKLCQGLLK
jgi:HEPN domain-containing protein